MRSIESEYFNEIASHPDVKPWMGFHSGVDIDYSFFVENTANYCFLTPCKQGGYMFQNQGNGHYVVHTLAAPAARGRPMFRLMQAVLQYLFTRTDCVEISTMVPDQNIPAKKWTDLAGFRSTFRRENHPLCLIDDLPANCQFYNLSYEDWLEGSKICHEEGKAFHELLETHLGHENHPEDEVHDHHVGAAVLGIKAGNGLKAISKYNRWAVLAGYQPCTILNVMPFLINIGTAVLQINDRDIVVLKTFT